MDAQSQWTGLDAARLERIDEHMERAYIGPRKIAGAQIAIARRYLSELRRLLQAPCWYC